MPKEKTEAEKRKERVERSKLAEENFASPAINLAMTHSLSEGGRYGVDGTRIVSGFLYTRDVKTPAGSKYAGEAASDAATEAYLRGDNVLASGVSNAAVAKKAYQALISRKGYMDLTVGQMAKVYGYEGKVDPKLADKFVDELDPENDQHKVLISLYAGFVQNMETFAVHEATGIAKKSIGKSIDDVVKPKEK